MSTSQAAEQIHTNATALRKGKITPDEFRARVRALKAELGETAYDAAKMRAVASMNR